MRAWFSTDRKEENAEGKKENAEGKKKLLIKEESAEEKLRFII